ncbi:MAG: SDR family NAD(P)-dependent oxidoreductase [Alphaproteobacteria bacterium]|nr:SDR family NAD(P)-dependent oxidoreductase [Alphaproteobacteria bacterium]
MQLEGRKVVLTGGGGGLGQLVAQGLQDIGADLHVVDRVDALPFDAKFLKADLGDERGIADASAAVVALKPDVLINLAGVQYFGPFERQAAAQIASGYMVNLIAPVLLSRAVIPGMRERGHGQIVNIGSVFGSIGFAHFVTYSSAKSGLRTFSEALRRELNGTDIAVTYIAPRAVRAGLSTPEIMRYAAVTKMNMDPPQATAARIVQAIAKRRKDVFIGFPESFFVRVNGVLPRLVDTALAPNDRKAATLFES